MDQEDPPVSSDSDPLAAPAEAPADSGLAAMVDSADLEMGIVEALKTVFDPEIPVNIYELGLIYDIDVQGSEVKLKMTLTSPGCPVAGSLPGEVKAKVEEVPGVTSADVELVWEPAWTTDRMSARAKAFMGW